MSAINRALNSKYKSFNNKETGELVEFYNPFAESQVQGIVDAMENSLYHIGGILYPEGPNEDVPIPFKEQI